MIAEATNCEMEMVINRKERIFEGGCYSKKGTQFLKISSLVTPKIASINRQLFEESMIIFKPRRVMKELNFL